MKALHRVGVQNLLKVSQGSSSPAPAAALCVSAAEKLRQDDKMSCWQIHSYGNMEELQQHHYRMPIISSPDEVLVKVLASSVNPIDVAMVGGYGATAFNFMRKIDNVEFPLIFGRDFSGIVVSKGLGSCNTIPVGTTVWGVVPIHQQGAHAEYVVVKRKTIAEAPKELNNYEAAGMLYTGLTAYSGLRWSADLNMKDMSGLKALVMGSSGGVGNAAVQLLKAGFAKVTATCSPDAVPMVEELGADLVLDYRDKDFEKKLFDSGRFDLIVDCAGLGTDYIASKDWEFRNYVTFTTPLLRNLDSLGLIRGSVTSATDIICRNVNNLRKGRTVKWAYFVPSADGIQHIGNLVRANKMRTIVDKVYQFYETPEAYKKAQSGHARGKVIIDVANSS